MYKVKMALANLVLTSLAGALMQFVWVLLSGKTNQLTPGDVINMMSISAIVGTICMFVLFHVTLRNMGSMTRAIVTNDVLVVILCFLIFLQTGIFFNNWSLDAKWIVILVIALTTSSVLTVVWYRQIRFYNGKLEKKKASLRDK